MDNKEITNYASPKCSTLVNGFERFCNTINTEPEC